MNKPRPTRYPSLDPVPTGMAGRCPRCGEGKLFTGVLKPKKQCSACGLDFEPLDAGDGPTVFIIMGLGFVILALTLYVEFTFQPPFWVHAILWPPIILATGLPIMRMMKGVLMALTYHHDAASGTLDRPDR